LRRLMVNRPDDELLVQRLARAIGERSAQP